MVEHHRPPEPDVPGDPSDARRPEVVALVLRPISSPDAAAILTQVQAGSRGAPKTLLGREALEMKAREAPGELQLAREVIDRPGAHRGTVTLDARRASAVSS